MYGGLTLTDIFAPEGKDPVRDRDLSPHFSQAHIAEKPCTYEISPCALTLPQGSVKPLVRSFSQNKSNCAWVSWFSLLSDGTLLEAGHSVKPYLLRDNC